MPEILLPASAADWRYAEGLTPRRRRLLVGPTTKTAWQGNRRKHVECLLSGDGDRVHGKLECALFDGLLPYLVPPAARLVGSNAARYSALYAIAAMADGEPTSSMLVRLAALLACTPELSDADLADVAHQVSLARGDQEELRFLVDIERVAALPRAVPSERREYYANPNWRWGVQVFAAASGKPLSGTDSAIENARRDHEELGPGTRFGIANTRYVEDGRGRLVLNEAYRPWKLVAAVA